MKSDWRCAAGIVAGCCAVILGAGTRSAHAQGAPPPLPPPTAPATEVPPLPAPPPAQPAPSTTQPPPPQSAPPAAPPAYYPPAPTATAPAQPTRNVIQARDVEPPPMKTGQRNFGFVLGAGFSTTIGGGIRLGTEDVGIEVLGGWMPVIIMLANGEPTSSSRSGSVSDVKVYSTGQVVGDAYVKLMRLSPKVTLALRGGYRYNDLMGHGIGLGGHAQLELSKAVAAYAMFGITVFPKGKSRVEDAKGIEVNKDLSPLGPDISSGLGVGLVLFP
ncbi:MAG: hypothetical protein HY898_21735 [Deltaproteobacteria bacterium]|nr:hypothetical protein [Deltaproteobacteria bacterium]